MLVAGFPAALFGTNCWVLAPGAGEECVVVDPGAGVQQPLDDLLAEHRLRPVAVVLTHGHVDHVMSVTPVCGARGIPAYVHPDDRDHLRDPLAWVSPQTAAQLGPTLRWSEPDDVRLLEDGSDVELAGVRLRVEHAPGHTGGSVLYGIADGGDATGGAPLCVAGDVLFAGSIGRTDLPGGSDEQMRRTLATKVLPLADETVVLPGHGPTTTIGEERRTNPYLARLARAGAGG